MTELSKMDIITKYHIKITNAEIQRHLTERGLNSIAIYLLSLLKGYAEYTIDNKSVEQKVNYSIYQCKKNNKSTLKDFIQLFTAITDKKTIFENSGFYTIVTVEFLQCFYYKKQHNGIASFMHIYRILERISYALPLIYAKSANDFSKTYESLKKFFSNSDSHTGELSFFKKSLGYILDDIEITFDFDFYFNTELKTWLDTTSMKDSYVVNTNNITVNIKTVQLLELIILLRNGLFHCLSGKSHISLLAMPNPDKILLKNMDNFINAVSYIICKIIEKQFTYK